MSDSSEIPPPGTWLIAASLIARAATADPETLLALNQEVEALGDELALSFGAPKTLELH